jgi:predicted transposase YbfD/YdcC
LSDILTIAICAVICDADSWPDVAAFGRAKAKWFKTFLPLPHGIPSRSTFERVFAALRPASLEACLARWTRALADASPGPWIAIDGKTLRRSFDRANSKAAIHMVSAWASANELVFGQLATEAKSNEITAIPKLLKLLDLAGATVTLDAMGCQKAIAGQILAQGGNYVLVVKDNQPTLHEELKLFLDDQIAAGRNRVAIQAHEQTDGGHGRVEVRRAWVTPAVEWFEDRQAWPGLKSFAAVECERTVGEKTSVERRYFISSLDGSDAAAMARAIRNHWGIENKLHWSLDMTFHEDQSRMRRGHSAENFSRLRRMALNLLVHETTARLSIRGKRKLAGWDHDYLLKLLTVRL